MEKFDFWMPIGVDLEKGGSGSDPLGGMYLEGIASTKDKDADGEFLDPEGFDLDYFMKGGIVNWHHQAAKDPDAIIGVPVSATITKAGLHIKVQLYDGDPLAEKVFRKAKQMQNSGLDRRMGFSIEGQATERDPDNENIVTKAMITGVAITHMPKNSNTFANICKSMSTTEGAPLIKESVDKDLKVTEYESNEENTEASEAPAPKTISKRRGLTKAVALELIFSSIGDITVSSAENVFRLAQHIAAADMQDNTKNFLTADVTDQDISKAVKALQLQKGSMAEPEEEDEDEDEDDEDEEDEHKGNKMSKAVNSNIGSNNKAFNVLVKGIANLGGRQRERDANMGILFKGMFDVLSKVNNRNEELATEVLDLSKALEDLTDKLDQPVARKGQVASVRDRNFDKGLEGGELEAKGTSSNANTVDITTQRGKNIVKGILGDLTFAKGFDQDYAQAALSFDANGTLNNAIVARIKADKGVEVVASQR